MAVRAFEIKNGFSSLPPLRFVRSLLGPSYPHSYSHSLQTMGSLGAAFGPIFRPIFRQLPADVSDLTLRIRLHI